MPMHPHLRGSCGPGRRAQFDRFGQDLHRFRPRMGGIMGDSARNSLERTLP